jgi:predicted metal-dependent hydrolase
MMQPTPTSVSIEPRDLHFDLSQVTQRHWLGGDPVGTAVMNALSLTFPDGEKLFMDAVRHFRKGLSGKLADDVRQFLAQEAMHSREHHSLNSLLDRHHYPVDDILRHVRERISFTRARGPYAMLFSTIALEHFTAILADQHLRQPDLFNNTDPTIKKLWDWHAVEETEHKAVAFDVFLEVTKHWSPTKRYLLRTWSMAYITWQFSRNIASHATRLLVADGFSVSHARRAVRGFLWGKPGLFRRVWRTYLSWYRPGFHPWNHDNSRHLAQWRLPLTDMES